MYRRFIIVTGLLAAGTAVAGGAVIAQTSPAAPRASVSASASASASADPQALLDRVYTHVSDAHPLRPDSRGVLITQADLDTSGTTVVVAVARASMLPAAEREFGIDGISYSVSSTVIMAGHRKMPAAH